MGLLDDAIREHLELKRQKGADPVDLAREEREALGPAVREPVAEVVGQAPATTPTADEGVDGLAIGDETSPAGAQAPAAYAAGADEDGPSLEPAPEAAASPPDASTPPLVAGGETVSFDAEDLWADDDVPARSAETADGPPPETGEDETSPVSDDVLEETPEFLQETPDHDRLWFEQKPPRDFDFDG